jgi:ribosome-associated protein
MISITARIAIPEAEIDFVASRSSGPGGQHTNKASTRVTLRFNIATSSALTDEQKARIRAKLRTRIGKDGILRVTAQTNRSQTVNRELALERFAALLRQALARKSPRRPTAPTAESRARRLESKRRRSEQKHARRAARENGES